MARADAAERPPSATAAGESTPDEAKDRQTSTTAREQKGRRLLTAGSGLGLSSSVMEGDRKAEAWFEAKGRFNDSPVLQSDQEVR